MNRIKILILIIFLSTICKAETRKIDPALDCTVSWLRAWELVSKDVFKLQKQPLARFVFFDSVNVYTTSPLTGNGGEEIIGPQLFDEKQTWFKKKHNGILILPDSSKRDVQLMTFASPTNEKNVKAYFVMPLLSFWIKEKVDGHGIGLEKLTAGVFTHEFSHTTQLESFDKFGAYFDEYQKKFGQENFGDDMMQNIFENDKLVKEAYEQEFQFFKNAGFASENERVELTKIAIESFNNKHKLITSKDKKDLRTLDDIWLTMEGVGQYAMYEYFINPKGANLTEEQALKAIKTRFWSQEEGFSMFYLLSKYIKPEIWSNDFFSSNMKTILDALQKEVD
ncbi:MAG: hypothetical protein ACRCVT_16340 [Leadbetterella sp.]